jgi:hypothetical protein
MVLRGTGVGQTRVLLGILDDNQTLVLDRPWGVDPDSDSEIVVFGTTV